MRTGVRFLVLLAVLLLTFGISHAQTEPCRAYLVVAVSPIDLVGGSEALSPDGNPDAHFRLHITAPGKSLTSLELRNTSGQYSVWDTISGNGIWVIAVVKGKEKINAPDGGIKLDLSQEEEILDLYVQDNGSITGGGTNYKLTLIFGDGSKVSIPVGTTGAVAQETPAASQPASGTAKVIFDNWNKEAVSNGPSRSTRFTVDRQTTITSIRNYHWNNMNGKEPGTIALIGSDGAIYGPWPTVGTSGTGGARNVCWEAKPNVSIPPGTYTVRDSDLATWSHNPSSGGAGFSSVTAEDSSSASTSGVVDLEGDWDTNANGYTGIISITDQTGSQFSGTFFGDNKVVNGNIASNTVTFTRPYPSGHQDYTGTLTVDSNGTATMTGTFNQDDSIVYKWTATKKTKVAVPTTTVPAGANVAKVLFDNWNKEAVSNSPARSTRFTVDRQTTITSIRNYHWNNMNGREPGMIALIGSDGAIYGPWSTVGTSGTGGARNVNWEAKPNVSIPPGTYTVIDSDLSTWSHNPSSGGAGFSCVTAEGSSASLTLEKNTFAPGEEIKVFFTAPPGLVEGSAWIGIIPSNVQHGSELVNDQHDMTYQRFKGTSGSLIFKAPEQPGSYDFRMNDSDSGGREIASVTFVVR